MIYNNYNDDCYNDYERNNYSNSYSHYDNNQNCCMKKTEETFCCYPSYYNEDKQEDNKDFCYEGYFKICPIYQDKYDNHNKCEQKNNHHKKSGCCRRFNWW